MRNLLLIFPILTASLPLQVNAGQLAELPQIVEQHIRDMNHSCREAGGKPVDDKNQAIENSSYPSNLVEHFFLEKGHVEIWAIDEGRYECDGAWSLFSGSGGSQIYFFARQNSGRVKDVFQIGAFGLKIKKNGQFSKIWLNVGGGWCDDPNPKCRACAKTCTRSLIWNQEMHKLDFAP